MPTNFPAAYDTFNEPTIPEETTLSSAGTGSRNHTEHHRDLGDATEAMQRDMALATHNHSGNETVNPTGKLDEANTHQNSDADQGVNSRHHTLGPNPHQAAAGDHVHDYAAITNTPYRIVTSTTRPPNPFLGLTILETDTNFMRVWSKVGAITAWHIAPLVSPICRLQQDTKQNLVQGGSYMEWHTELEDNNNFFNPGVSLTDIHIVDGGLYHIDAAVQWNTDKVPDTCFMAITVNGNETTLRSHRFQRGENFIPGFSQTIHTSGKYRFVNGDVVRLKVDYTASQGLLGFIVTFFEQLIGQAPYSKVTSRIELAYMSP